MSTDHSHNSRLWCPLLTLLQSAADAGNSWILSRPLRSFQSLIAVLRPISPTFSDLSSHPAIQPAVLGFPTFSATNSSALAGAAVLPREQT